MYVWSNRQWNLAELRSNTYEQKKSKGKMKILRNNEKKNGSNYYTHLPDTQSVFSRVFHCINANRKKNHFV